MGKFLQDIGQGRRNFIKNISTSLTEMAHGIKKATKLMYQCLSLEKLEIKMGKIVLSLTPSPSWDDISTRMVFILLELRGIKELILQPRELIIPSILTRNDNLSFQLGLQKEEKAFAGKLERILSETVCKERRSRDSLSEETQARRQAEKGKQREKTIKRHLEWQMIKRR